MKVEIRVGTVYLVRGDDGQEEVVTDIGQKRYFESGRLFYNGRGEPMLTFNQGTSGPENIDRILRTMKPREVIAAARRFWLEHFKNRGGMEHIFDKDCEPIYQENIKRGTREIEI